jgi:methylase of polypeptide subunit release factors
LFEIGHTQGKAVKDLLANAGFDMIQLVTDLAGNDRVVLAKNP